MHEIQIDQGGISTDTGGIATTAKTGTEATSGAGIAMIMKMIGGRAGIDRIGTDTAHHPHRIHAHGQGRPSGEGATLETVMSVDKGPKESETSVHRDQGHQ